MLLTSSMSSRLYNITEWSSGRCELTMSVLVCDEKVTTFFCERGGFQQGTLHDDLQES